jgi:CRISPR-associated protein Cas5d
LLFHVAIRGERACFRRPEFQRDPVSYDVMPPPVAVAILSSIHAATAFTWAVERITLIEPWQGGWDMLDGDRASTAVPAWIIHRPHYVVAARMLGAPGVGVATIEQHGAAFVHQMLGGALTPQPYLGVRECVATCHLIPPGVPVTAHPSFLGSERDLGWLPYESGTPADPAPRYFRAVLRDGVLSIPPSPPERLAR